MNVTPKPLAQSTPANTRPRVLAQIVAHQVLGPNLGCVTLQGPNLGVDVRAGQFAMVWRPSVAGLAPQDSAPRPFAYFSAPNADTVVFLARERPESTTSLLRAPLGTVLPVLGPLGQPFPRIKGVVWAVAGGVGAAAFGNLLPASPQCQVRILLGMRSQAEAGVEAALRARLGAGLGELVAITEDGPDKGTAGDLLMRSLAAATKPPDAIFACGPQPLLQKCHEVAQRLGRKCYVSVNTPMDCGIGICKSCRITDQAGVEHLACVDGPIYETTQLF